VQKTFFTSDTHFGHENIMKYCRRVQFMTPDEVAMLDAADRGEIDHRKVRISPESVERMNRAMIDNINAVVGEGDILYHVGDVFWGHDLDFARSLRSQIRCRTIHHIWGNHDEPGVTEFFASSQQYAMVMVEHHNIFLCHYPMRTWDKSHKGAWCLYGHVHGSTWEEDATGLSKADRAVLVERFNQFFVLKGLSDRVTEALTVLSKDMVAIVANQLNYRLTLDIGVDTHDYRPWSMDELRAQLHPKIEAWRRIS
jgi:calcineurin-like phosphoesterase family protein